MFCTGCGSPIHANEHFCHHCGRQLAPLSGGHPPYRQKTAPWVIVTALVVLALIFYGAWAGSTYSNLEQPVKAQLLSIKEGKIPEAYYEYTSKQFQAATSLDQFRQFIEQHPILKQYVEANFQDPQIDDQRGLLHGELAGSEGESIAIKFFLHHQDSEWKIDSIQFSEDNPQIVEAAELDDTEKQAIMAPVENQLEDLKRGNIKDAYMDVSEGFKKATSEPEYEEFVGRYPILNSYNNYVVTDQLRHGEQAAVRLELIGSQGRTPVEFYLVQEDNRWKIWSLQVLLPSEDLPAASLMVQPVQAQLQALKDKKLDQAYNDNVSKEFKEITTLDTFKNFVVRFPIFTDYTSVDYKQPRIEDSGGKLIVTLKNADGTSATVEYTMGVSDGVWKIWGLRLVDIDASQMQQSAQTHPEFSAKLLESIAIDQLDALKNNNVSDAYYQFTSPQFQKVTNFETFQRFIDAYPVFKNHYSVALDKLTVENNVATLKGTITDAQGITYPLEYDFVQDGSNWKVLRIQIFAPEQPSSGSYYGVINMGDAVDAAGNITHKTTTFYDPKKEIYANIFVNGTKGDVVTVVFRHKDSQSAIYPVTSGPLPKDGEFRTSFSFTPPPSGWPLGNYQLEISSSSGQTKTFDFNVQ